MAERMRNGGSYSIFTHGVECCAANKMRGFFPFGKLRVRMTIPFPSTPIVEVLKERSEQVLKIPSAAKATFKTGGLRRD